MTRLQREAITQIIDPTSETLIKLADVPRLRWMPRPRGKRLHVSTIFRWAQRGVHGAVLETIRIGGTLYTSEEALLRFFERQTNPDNSETRRPSKARQRAITAAERELEKAGI
jgi:hypothetical protein